MKHLTKSSIGASLLFLMIGLVPKSAIGQEHDWKRSSSTSRGLQVFYDAKSISRVRQNVTVWVKYLENYATSNEQTEYALLTFDCATKKFQQKNSATYNSEGRTIRSSDQPSRWSYVIPETVTETLLGVLCFGKPDLASQEEAQAIDSEVSTHRLKALGFSAAGKYVEAIEEYRKAIALKPEDDDYGGLAFALEKAGKSGEATSAYKLALQKSPQREDLYVGLGRIYEESGDTAAALDIYWRGLKATTVPPTSLYYALERLHRRKKNTTALINLYQYLRSKYPKELSFTLSLAAVYDKIDKNQLAKGLRQNAIRELETRIRSNPTPRDFSELFWFHLDLRDQKRTIEVLEAGVARFPREISLWHLLGGEYIRQGLAEKAVGALNNALNLNPYPGWQADLLDNLATAYSRLGKYAEATSAVEKAMAVEPSSTWRFLSSMAEIEMNRNPQRALELIDKSLGLRADFVYGNIVRGKILEKLGRDEEATMSYSKAIQLNPDADNARFALGTVLARTGNKAGALTQYRVLLKTDPESARKLYAMIR